MWVLSFAVIFLSDEPLLPSPVEIFERYVDGRSMLRSGQVRSDMLIVEKAERPDVVHQEIRVSVRSLFDFDRSWFRHEVEKDWAFITGPGFDKLSPLRTGDVHLLTPEHRAQKPLNTKRIDVTLPGGLPVFDDLRLCGAIIDDESQTVKNMDAGLEYLVQVATRPSVNTRVEKDGMLWKVVCDIPVGKWFLRRITWFDANQQWVPVRLVQQRVSSESNAEHVLCTQNELSVSWTTVSDVAVPESKLETRYLIDGATNQVAGKREIATTFVWNIVNEELDKQEFEVASLDVPRRSHVIYDSRSGTDIIVQHPSVPDGKKLKRIVAANALTQSPPKATSSGFILFFLANFGAILIAAVVLFLRRRKRSGDQYRGMVGKP